MKKFTTIESWASNIGYVVESDSSGEKYTWYRESTQEFKICRTIGEVIEAVLDEVRRGYEGEK